MKKIVKPVTVLMMTAMLSASVLTACGGSKTEATTVAVETTTAGEETTVAAEETTEAAAEETTEAAAEETTVAAAEETAMDAETVVPAESADAEATTAAN